MKQPIDITRLQGLSTRHEPDQVEPGRAVVAMNVEMGKQSADKRKGYRKATRRAQWGRSTRLNGLGTGILASQVPHGLDTHWDDADGANTTRITFQVRVKPLGLDGVTQTQIPYSLDYNGDTKYPTESVTGPGGAAIREDSAMGFESADALLWKPIGSNRYDTRAGIKFPWLPGIETLTADQAALVRPKMACVFGTGPLREYPLWQRDQFQQHLVDLGAWTTPTFNVPAPWLTQTNVGNGDFDAGDLYVFYVFSPITNRWYLMALWEYSDPGNSAIVEHFQGMNRMFVFVGNGGTADDFAAVPVDINDEHTITLSFVREAGVAGYTGLELALDDPWTQGTPEDYYGKVRATNAPAPSHTDAPTFGLKELSGNGAFRNGWRGRTLYLGGLPKATNQRGVWGYGCGRSVNRGGTMGVTCPFPGALTELRLYAGPFDISSSATRDIRSASLLAPHDSRTVKKAVGGAAWPDIDPSLGTKYDGTVNIWRLDEVAGDVFPPLYTFADAGFWTGGKPAGGLQQDFHAFEPVGNGTNVGPGVLQGASGGMRFNGGSPAFLMSAGVLLDVEGTADDDSAPTETYGLLKPPRQFAWGGVYTPLTAPEFEPWSQDGPGADTPFPEINVPTQGEVHTLMQLMAPMCEGKTDTVVPIEVSKPTYDLGHTQGAPEGFDHPDTVWEGNAWPSGGAAFKPQGRRKLEVARIDLVAHTVYNGASYVRRWYFRADFGYGATLGDYTGKTPAHPDGWSDPEEANQQHGNERMFRSSADVGSVQPFLPSDVDDNYYQKGASGADNDDRYCWVQACDAGGNALSTPDALEGRSFAFSHTYAINPDADPDSQEVGTQTLHVWDVTDPANVFELTPSEANASQKLAEAGMTFAPTTLFGTSKHILCLGGKLTPQDGSWWIGGGLYGFNHMPGQDPNAYPYGAFSIANTGDQAEDPFSVRVSGGTVFNGAKGVMDIACTFRQGLSATKAVEFFTQLAATTDSWGQDVPRAAADVIGDDLASAWLCDDDGGPVVVDPVRNLNIGLDQKIGCDAPTGRIQYNPVDPKTSIAVYDRNLPYTYNGGTFEHQFPDALVPVRLINTWRHESLYDSDEFSSQVIINDAEPANTQPNKEPLLAVFGHYVDGRRRAMVAGRTMVWEYDRSGDGELVAKGPLPQHFSPAHVVSRDVSAERVVLANGAARPVVINDHGVPQGDRFIDPPQYGVPVVWARAPIDGLEPPAYTDSQTGLKTAQVYKVAFETTRPLSRSVIGIERVEAASGLRWTGEMPDLIDQYTGSPSTPYAGLVRTPPVDILNWRFFFVYYSQELDAESFPGRVFTWSNVLPLRNLQSGDVGFGQGDPGQANRYTLEPGTAGLALVMFGQLPQNIETVLGVGAGLGSSPKQYNLKITGLPVSSNPHVTHIRCYRTRGNGDTFFLDSEIPVPAGAAAGSKRVSMTVGVKRDSELSGSPTFVGGVASRVPIGARIVCAYQGRAFYTGFAWAPSRVMWSYLDQPEKVPFFYSVDLVSVDSTPITAMWVDNDRLHVAKENATYSATVRDFDVYTIAQSTQGLPVAFELLTSRMGAVSDRAVAVVPERGTVLAGDTSVWLSSGPQRTRVSAAIDENDPSDVLRPASRSPYDERRDVYPSSLDTAGRVRWVAIYHPQSRKVVLFAGSDKPQLVLHPDLLEWSVFEGWDFDDVDVINDVDGPVSTMYGIRDSRLWVVGVGNSDGIDYECENKAGERMVFYPTGTNLTVGLVGTAVSTTEFILSIFTSALPPTYQAMLHTSSMPLVDQDFLRDVPIVFRNTDGTEQFALISAAWQDAGFVRITTDRAITGVDTSTIVRIGSIDASWFSARLRHAHGELELEVDQSIVIKGRDKETVQGFDLRGGIAFFTEYGTWPVQVSGDTGAVKSFANPEDRKLIVRGKRGRGYDFMVGWTSIGAYSPASVQKILNMCNIHGHVGTLTDG